MEALEGGANRGLRGGGGAQAWETIRLSRLVDMQRSLTNHVRGQEIMRGVSRARLANQSYVRRRAANQNEVSLFTGRWSKFQAVRVEKITAQGPHII